ncbi:MAG: flagellar export protein FliJ [Lachnospiraceae bacterium]|nr:flagellar export protein FliJ [Lachnospiraceae bacterium]
MAKFRYSMQNVLDVKYKLEDQAKTAFSQAQMKVNEAQEQLQLLVQRREGYEEQKQCLMQNRLDVRKLNECQQAIETMEYYERNQKKKIAALEAVLDNARRKLQEAMIDRKTHEKLKDNEFQVFLQELNEQEKKEIDELVSFQHNKTEEEESLSEN